ncbi:Protein of uncharacterised function (DUF551) [Yersinia enterocolitica]|uniref:Protein of uncharacterized function (DUF551) n=1 Tax=Yersinia enterocolitica TaxID=630 RepID=A0A9P1V595_YEREN|nr:DUF551 domain-containing protein [Yersinia enterocolitica]CNG10451.1 Protein of uncharacterised function (DUF551) [Yersinia enterocolitica]
MKELDSFTVEQLNDFIKSDHAQCGDVAALARIALAAKRAEPVGYLEQNHLDYLRSGSDADIWPDGGAGDIPVYLTPQLNSQVPLGSWIKCSDRMPENDEFVLIWPLPDFGVELHVGQYIKFHKNGPGWFAQVYEYNYGVEFYPITVTHWMPLPAAPEKPL